MDVLFWVVVQCRKRIALRFHVGTIVWTTPPWKIMEDWKPEVNEASTSPRITIGPDYRKNLSTCGFPDDGEGVNRWINCLGKLLSTAHELCNSDDEASLMTLTDCLSCAHLILRSTEVQDELRGAQSLSNAFHGTWICCNGTYSPSIFVGVAVNALSAHGSSPKLGDTPEADSVDDAIEGDDDVASAESSEEYGTL